MSELLKVLDMSEDEQLLWCAKNAGFDMLDATLADFAFRLRDEWSRFGAFYSAMLDVQEYLKIEKYTSRRAMSYKFWAIQAQPIHWILASLIAKEAE